MTELQTTWNPLVAIYLFLGGLGAGAGCTVALIALSTGERFKRTVRFGTWASAIILALGATVLLVDVGKPFRAMFMFNSFVNFSSWMTIGAWLLLTAVVVNGLAALFWTDVVLGWLGRLWKPLSEKRVLWRTILAIVAIPISLAVAIYTGILLGVLPFRPLWHSWLLPVLFTVSAMDTGVALVTGFSFLREDGAGVKTLRTVLESSAMVLILAEAAVLGFFLDTVLKGSADGARSVQVLTQGALRALFLDRGRGRGAGRAYGSPVCYR